MRELRVIFSLVTSSKWLLLLRESKKSEQSEDSPSLKWCVTTTKVDPAKGIRTLWDKNHREYRKTLLLKKILMPLVAKMERSKMANSRRGNKNGYHDVRASAKLYFKKHLFHDGK